MQEGRPAETKDVALSRGFLHGRWLVVDEARML